jgi:putative acetyltransferase
MFSIRSEDTEDYAAIRAVNEQAFGQSEEADIVDNLRNSGGSVLSLVAIHDNGVIGHIQFSPVTIEYDGGVIEGAGLGPMAVRPDFQGQGIGSALAEAGLTGLRDRTTPFVVVLGHPNYYPRFGFEPASRHAIACQWEKIPDEAFMVLILDDGVMSKVFGVAYYRDEFG